MDPISQYREDQTMRNNFEEEFIRSMDTLRFSPEDKKRMAGNILRYRNQKEEREDTIVKKWTLPKAAAVFAACLFITGGTVFGASRLVMYTASSNGSYDYSSLAEMNDATSGVSDKEEVEIPEFPEVLGGYTFDGGNTVNVSGKDDAGNTLGKWDDLRAVYKNEGGSEIYLYLSAKMPDEEDRTPTETRTINGITVTHTYEEYLFLPPDAEGDLDPEIQKRLDTDDHFYVSYGSSEKETCFYSNASFVKDGISYDIFTRDVISADELFNMAAELISR